MDSFERVIASPCPCGFGCWDGEGCLYSESQHIQDLHDSSSFHALNAGASLRQAQLCINAGYAFDGLAWLELYESDLRIAERFAEKASELESEHGSVFPGVRQ